MTDSEASDARRTTRAGDEMAKTTQTPRTDAIRDKYFNSADPLGMTN